MRKEVIMFDKIFERLDLHSRAIRKLTEVTDKLNEITGKLSEKADNDVQLNIVQLLINNGVETRLKELEEVNVAERLEHMEEYIDVLTKRVKELEK